MRLLLFLLLFATTLVEAELLVFNETTGLPTCAYGCTALYNAQYECPSPGPEQVKCFCASKFLGWAVGGWVGCGEACTDKAEEARVDAWMKATCGGGGNDQIFNSTAGSNTTTIGGINPNDVTTNSTQIAEAQATKVREWWKRNYAFFVLAFLVVTVPIICYAVAIPVRKWCKRQLIRRRPRSQAYMEDIAPYTSVFGPDGSRHNLSSVGVLPDPENVIPPVTSVRQESWEARVRDQFAPKKTLGERMMFWSKKA